MWRTKELCEEIAMPYETLKFYCKEGLIPNVKRDKNNYRIFDEKNIEWIKGLQKLRECGMSIKDMKEYMNYCLEGPSTITKRKEMLQKSKKELLEKINKLKESIEFIDSKEAFYDDVLNNKIEYVSNLIDLGSCEKE